jgi:hypothetical protein
MSYDPGPRLRVNDLRVAELTSHQWLELQEIGTCPPAPTVEAYSLCSTCHHRRLVRSDKGLIDEYICSIVGHL